MKFNFFDVENSFENEIHCHSIIILSHSIINIMECDDLVRVVLAKLSVKE